MAGSIHWGNKKNNGETREYRGNAGIKIVAGWWTPRTDWVGEILDVMLRESNRKNIVSPAELEKKTDGKIQLSIAKNTIFNLEATIKWLQRQISEMEKQVIKLENEKATLCSAILAYQKLPFINNLLNQETLTDTENILSKYKENQ